VFENVLFRGSIDSAEGVKQGDCLGSLLFALSMHPTYFQCTRGLANVKYVAIADDLNLFGSANDVLTSLPTRKVPNRYGEVRFSVASTLPVRDTVSQRTPFRVLC